LRAVLYCEGALDLMGQTVLLADDGLATGATMEAAVLAARKQDAWRIVVAVPVASPSAVQRLERVADEVKALLMDPGFEAVGQYYEEFAQTSDDEVLALLAADKQASR
jgi:putative phosphoribosyl transferase